MKVIQYEYWNYILSNHVYRNGVDAKFENRHCSFKLIDNLITTLVRVIFIQDHIPRNIKLPNTQIKYFQVEYIERNKYSTFSTDFTW